MHITTDTERKDFFRFATNGWTARDVLLPFVEGKKNITVKDIERMDPEKVVVGTQEESLDGILNDDFTLNTTSVVDKIDNHGDQVLVLPPNYRCTGEQGRDQRAYSMDTLFDLDSILVRRMILGNKDPGRRLNKREKEKFQWNPAQVYRTAIAVMNQNPGEYIRNQLMGFRWRGTDDALRVVRTINIVEMLELRMLQNLAYYKIQFPEDKEKWEVEIKTGYDSETQEKLRPGQIREREAKIINLFLFFIRFVFPNFQ